MKSQDGYIVKKKKNNFLLIVGTGIPVITL